MAIAYGAAVGVVVFVIAVSSGFVLREAAESTLTDQTRRELINTATFGASGVDPAVHQNFKEPAQEQGALYEKALAPLQRVLNSNPEVEFIYTLVMDGDTVRFVLDPTPAGDADDDGLDDKSHIWQEYEEPTPAMLKALREGVPTVEAEPTVDPWGAFISGYAPIRSADGRLIGVVGVDLSAEDYLARLAGLAAAMRLCVALGLILGFVSSLFAYSLRCKANRNRYHERHTSLIEAQRHILQLVASSAPLGKLLGELCRRIECLSPGLWCSIWVQKPGGGVYRAVSHTISNRGTANTVIHEVGCHIVGSDGGHLGRVMLKVEDRRTSLSSAQEVCDMAASLAAAAIEKRTSEDNLRAAHRELELAREDLETKVAERTKELERVTQAKSEFIAELSHEVRNPLNGVIGMSDLILETDLDAEQHEYAGIIRDGAQQILRLMDGMLDLAKIEAGRLTMEFEPVNLTDELQTICKPFRHTCADRHLQFQLVVCQDLDRTILCCPLRFRQIMNNLLGNALKFTHEGSIRVEGQLEQTAKGEFAVIRVRDSGSGIPDSIRDQVFAKFVQASQKHGGAGLGLPITKELIEAMGGEIAFETEVGVGTVFTFKIPMRKHRLKAA